VDATKTCREPRTLGSPCSKVPHTMKRHRAATRQPEMFSLKVTKFTNLLCRGLNFWTRLGRAVTPRRVGGKAVP